MDQQEREIAPTVERILRTIKYAPSWLYTPEIGKNRASLQVPYLKESPLHASEHHSIGARAATRYVDRARVFPL